MGNAKIERFRTWDMVDAKDVDRLSGGQRSIRGDWGTRHVFIGIWEGTSERNVKRLLPGPSQRLYNYSPDGFNWGYAGSGPAQLALAMMLHYLPSDEALAIYQEFKGDVIANIPMCDFAMPEREVKQWIVEHSPLVRRRHHERIEL